MKKKLLLGSFMTLIAAGAMLMVLRHAADFEFDDDDWMKDVWD